MPKEKFSAQATVQATIEVNLNQCWGNENVEEISRKTKKEAQSFLNNLVRDNRTLKCISIDSCSISLKSVK